MDIKKHFQATPIPGEAMKKNLGAHFISLARKTGESPKELSFFQPWLRFGFALLLLLIVPLSSFHFVRESFSEVREALPEGGDIGFVVMQSGASDSLLAEVCMDRESLTESVDYILEGTVTRVEPQLNEENSMMSTYSTIEIRNYVKGQSIPGNTLQIVTAGGLGQWVEDQAIFYQGTEVRIYLKEVNGEFIIFCGPMGLEEISGNLSYRVQEGCNMEGPEGNPVSESITLSQSENAIHFEQMLQLPSSDNPFSRAQGNFKINYSPSGHNIEIREILDPEVQDLSSVAVCSTYVSGQIDGLEQGSYTLTFIFEDQGGETRVLEEKTFVLE